MKFFVCGLRANEFAPDIKKYLEIYLSKCNPKL